MALKVIDWKATVGRDKDKVFVITEMPASQAEKWALKAFLALARSGVEIPNDIKGLGIQGVFVIGLKSMVGLQFKDAENLMDEMFTCVQVRPDAKANYPFMRPPVEEDIEEVQTRIELRLAIFELHTGFSLADAVLTSPPTGEMTSDSKNTQTSPPPLVQ